MVLWPVANAVAEVAESVTSASYANGGNKYRKWAYDRLWALILIEHLYRKAPMGCFINGVSSQYVH